MAASAKISSFFATRPDLSWVTLMELKPGEKVQVVDRLKIEFYEAPFLDSVIDRARINPRSANLRFQDAYNEYFFKSDICQEIDKKLETLKTANGSYKMKLCNLPTKLIDYCEKKFNNAKILLKKYNDWSPPTS